ncbi:hypothetical protein AAFF_G00090750 [Aldrovandia affinis]|uniref:CCHC-type domain-containing protein n=1 Tax=Aldrovandia affinis TaxID=143900 RepID=A0AAD7WC61_9TELE|nr:hypothetical protein AAFF_G00090750 [Aldrovandia affinis]
MRGVFDRSSIGRAAARQLLQLRQGEQSVLDYSIEFRTLAASAGWNAVATYDAFMHGLSERVLDQLTVCDLPLDLDRLVDLAIRIDMRLQERGKRHRESPAPPCFRPATQSSSPAQPTAITEPMQLNRAHLSEAERQRRREGGLCLYCGGRGHFRSSCPVKDKRPSVKREVLTGASQLSTFRPQRPMLHVVLSWQGEQFPVQALIDSGADTNLICSTLVHRMGVPVSQLVTPLQTKTLTGTPLAVIEEITQPLELLVSGNHRERLAFCLMESPCAPLVLGGPWLATHNPSIDWTTGHIREWSPFCQKSCLRSRPPWKLHTRG